MYIESTHRSLIQCRVYMYNTIISYKDDFVYCIAGSRLDAFSEYIISKKLRGILPESRCGVIVRGRGLYSGQQYNNTVPLLCVVEVYLLVYTRIMCIRQ